MHYSHYYESRFGYKKHGAHHSTSSLDQPTTMETNFLISLLCLLSMVAAAPQQDFLQSLGGKGGFQKILDKILTNPVIQQRILKNKLNPCDGDPPTTCQCDDGETIPFSIKYRKNPCSGTARPDQCTCPKGNSFQLKDLADDVINEFNLPNCGRGVQPSFCTCRDGSTFSPQAPKTKDGPPCEGIGLGALPTSCTCPGGNTITTNDFISSALPAIQDLLG
eukprot:GFUD01048946.1.p1 GENE.GFUD01048946.1~~GFUD01048946.1.p1  ORF type:complete len:220 (-),score=43.71 GFUD01048946.1:201-860(-)